MENININLAISELHKGFNLLNCRYFDGTLPEPSILIQSKGNKKNVLGWCTTKKIWLNESTQETRYEINLVAEYLNRKVNGVMETLLHEMIHLYCLVNDLKDVSRNGTYHNKVFKAEAEKRGLKVEHDNSLGWAYTALSPEAEKVIKEFELDERPFALVRLDRHMRPLLPNGETPDGEEGGEGDGGDDDKPKTSSRKYVCPKCQTIIRATKEVNVICGDCMVKFELEEK